MNTNKKQHLRFKINPEICNGYKFNMITRVINKIYRKHLSPLDVTINQLNILFVIGIKQEIYQVELAKLLYLDPSTISRDLERLIKKKYILKLGYNNRPLIKMTEEGFNFVQNVIPHWKKAQKETESIINEDEIISINNIISTIRN